MKCIILFLLFSFCSLAKSQTHIAKVDTFNFTSQQQLLKMVYVYAKAAKPNGTNILLLHGKNFSHTYWNKTIFALTAKGFNVIAPDQIGFGSSSKPTNYQYSFQQCVLNTKTLLDSLGIQTITIIGHSMGGMIATRFALMYPQFCSKLILENPIGLEDWKTVVPYSSIDEEFKKEKKKTREQLKEYFTKNYFHNQWKEDYNIILDETAGFYRSSDSLVYARCMALTSDMIFTQPICYEFKNLKVPTILIIGQADKTAIGKERVGANISLALGNYAQLGKQTALLIPNCRLIELNGLGHIPHVEDFTVFIKSLESCLQ